MANIDKYREIITHTLTEYAAIPYAYGNITSRTVFDREQDVYLIYVIGWNDRGRVHGVLVHIDIIDGKIWIQRDGTEDGMATDLERAGVPKTDIVLGFHAPELRQYTDYAVA